MKMVVLNAGSGSQRCSLFELPAGPLPDEPMKPSWEAKLDATAPVQPPGKIVPKIQRGDAEREVGAIEADTSIAGRAERLLCLLWTGPHAAREMAGGHRLRGVSRAAWGRGLPRGRAGERAGRSGH